MPKKTSGGKRAATSGQRSVIEMTGREGGLRPQQDPSDLADRVDKGEPRQMTSSQTEVRNDVPSRTSTPMAQAFWTQGVATEPMAAAAPSALGNPSPEDVMEGMEELATMASQEVELVEEIATVRIDPELFLETQKRAIAAIDEALGSLKDALLLSNRQGTSVYLPRLRELREDLMRQKAVVLKAAPLASPTAGSDPTQQPLGETSRPIKPFTPVPRWSGQVADYFTWKREVKRYFDVYQQISDDQKLLFMRQSGVLKADAELATRNCREYGDFWVRLEERFTPMEVANEITRIIKDLEPIRRRDRDEARRVLSALSDYCLRMQDNQKADQLEADLVVHEATSKLGPFSEGLGGWMALMHKGETWSVNHIVSYIREKIAHMSLNPPTIKSGWKDRQVKDERSGDASDKRPPGREQSTTADTRRNKPGDDSLEKRKQDGQHRLKFNNAPPRRVNFTDLSQESSQEAPKDETAIDTTESGKDTNSCEVIVTCSEIPPAGWGERRTITVNSSRLGIPNFSPTTYMWSKDMNGVTQRLVTFIDEGSDITVLSQAAAERLGLKAREFFDLTYQVLGGTVKQKAAEAKICVSNADGEQWELDVLVLNGTTGNSVPIDDEFWRRHEYLAEARGFLPEQAEAIDLLVGYGQKGLTIPIEVKTKQGGPVNEFPVAVKCSLGWTLFGPVQSAKRLPSSDTKAPKIFAAAKANDEESLGKLFSKWCGGESLGVQPTQLCSCKPSLIEESSFLKIAEKYVKRAENGRMEVKLPWKEGFPKCLPNNRAAAAAFPQQPPWYVEKKGLDARIPRRNGEDYRRIRRTRSKKRIAATLLVPATLCGRKSKETKDSVEQRR